ncbi:MAG: MBL fold metallo-hydrolase [Alphaproteobacteria bacterium]
MKVEMFNSATIAAPGRLFDPLRSWARVGLSVRYGVFEHPDLGLTLIDTGYGARCFGSGVRKSFGLWLYTLIFQAKLHPEGQVQRVLTKKGYVPEDVKTIIVSHLHADHISELKSFVNARFIGSRQAFETVTRARWKAPLSHGTFPELLPEDFESRLDAIEDLPACELPSGLGQGWELLPGEVSLVPLDGHAAGHFGVYFSAENLLYAVDAHWVLSGLEQDGPLFGLPKQIAVNADQAEETLSRLRAFQRTGGTVVLCHEPTGSSLDVF